MNIVGVKMDLYITSNGSLNRKENTLIFKNEKTKRIFPVKDIESIYAYGEISINSKLLIFLSRLNIPVYFFNYYGFYSGVFSPKEQNISGKLLVAQVKYYDNKEKRLEIAREIVFASIHNMRKTIMQYGLNEEAEKMRNYLSHENYSINQLMGIEANVKKLYFKCFNKILNDENFKFIKRVRQDPDNFINSLISFGNSLLYTTTLSEIFRTQLNPSVSYLHEPFERRYSLNLDIADVFKPLIVDRVIFSLINQKMIRPEHFDKRLNYCYLNKEGRTLFLREYDKKLKTTIKYPGLNRKVSYRYMLRLEGYKLIKHLLNEKKFKAFRIYW